MGLAETTTIGIGIMGIGYSNSEANSDTGSDKHSDSETDCYTGADCHSCTDRDPDAGTDQSAEYNGNADPESGTGS